MSTDPRRALGTRGESLAAEHLTRRGCRIIERNSRTRFGEIDLIAVDARHLIFCEVKTRVAGTSAGPAGPLDAIGSGKRRRLRRLAGEWLDRHPPSAARPYRPELRFDAIGITVGPRGELLELEHLEGAF